MVMRRVPILEEFEYQQNVESRTLTSPPASPTEGDRYIVAPSAIGSWVGQDNKVAWWDSTQWIFETPWVGWGAYVVAESVRYEFNGSIWVKREDTDQLVKADATDPTAGYLDAKVDDINITVNATTHKIEVKSGSSLATTIANSHAQNTDQYLDFGGANQVAVADVKDAVTKKHIQGTDLGLDTGGANPITAATIKGHVDDVLTNPHNVTAAQVGAIPTSEKGAANGVATLDATGKVPASELPSYVDDVLEYANLAAFPVTGETGKIYVALDTNKTYRWSGTVYTEISVGDVSSVNTKTGVVVLVTDDIAEDASPVNLWYTEARVSANTDVSANTSARHTQGTDLGLDTGGSNPVTAATIVAHIGDATIHRAINDAGTSTTELLSSSYIRGLVTGAADTKKVLVSVDDTTEGYLESKVIGTTNKIVVSTINPGGNEQLQVNIGSNVFDKAVDDLDDIADGTIYGRVLNTELTINGEVSRLNDGSNTVTALEGQTAYDRRAQYSAALKAIVFDNL